MPGARPRHIRLVFRGRWQDAAPAECQKCQTSCQSACKTSCTVSNQPCPVDW
ncbi:MAG TPA: six-cysteine peptide SCIFF [Firmicutes bacterium]|nr:six-cysteine peptide SCIFF [Bacillota bacterium]